VPRRHAVVVAGISLCLITVEAILIAGLWAQRRRRRRAEDALRASEERYRDVVESQSHLICRYLPDTTLTFVNEAYCRFWNMSRDELIGRKFIELIPEGVRDDVLRRIASLVEHPRIDSLEHAVLKPGGGLGWQHWTNHALVDGTGTVVELQGVGHDVSERKRATDALKERESELRVAYQRVRDLGGRLIAAQESERARIARDLHDDLSQRLALISIDVEQLANDRPSPQQMARIHDVARRVGDVAFQVHHLSHQLHPSGLSVLGLAGAIEAFCRDVSVQHGLSVDFERGEVPGDLPPDVSLSFFRIAQEALQNVAKHSGATRASVQLVTSADARYLELRVIDSGAGFDPVREELRGVGLVGMRERASFVGGTFVIQSEPGLGTRLGVRAPLKGAAIMPLTAREVAEWTA
jgi:PAS domain S-box-containing protein